MSQSILLVAALLVEVVLFTCLVLVGYLMVVGVLTVPWVRTRPSIARSMLELGGYAPHERVLDLGSGDGTIVLEAAAQGGGGVGMERVGILVQYARLKAWVRGFSGKTQFIKADIFTAPLPEAQLITSYLFPAVNARVEPRLLEAFPVGTRVISRDFCFPTLRLVKEIHLKGSNLFLYEL
ncbi:hypothetical protein HY631_01790 [Candidatus Uhrbacteria bacterium]|nr:hypothetical protein [Candidatus Uhrbacteria bacterium]